MKRFLCTLLSLLFALTVLAGCETTKPPVLSGSTDLLTQDASDSTQAPTDAPKPPVMRTLAVPYTPIKNNPNWKDTANLPEALPEQEIAAELILTGGGGGCTDFFAPSLITNSEELEAYFDREKPKPFGATINQEYDRLKDHDFSQSVILIVGKSRSELEYRSFVKLLVHESSLIVCVESDYNPQALSFVNSSWYFAVSIKYSDLAALGELEEIYLYTTYPNAPTLEDDPFFYSPAYDPYPSNIYPLSRYVYEKVTK